MRLFIDIYPLLQMYGNNKKKFILLSSARKRFIWIRQQRRQHKNTHTNVERYHTWNINTHGHADLSVALQTIVEMIFPEILIFWTIEIVDSTCKNVKYLCISFSRQRWRCVLLLICALQIHALGAQSNSFQILLLSISWIKCLFFFLLVIFM